MSGLAMIEKSAVNVEQRAVVGVFADAGELEAAASELLSKGFGAAALGLVAPAHCAPAGIGTGAVERVGRGSGGEPLVVTGSALPAVIAAAALAAQGGDVLPAIGRRLEPAVATLPADTLLLWVQVESGDDERRAVLALGNRDVRSIHHHKHMAPTSGDNPLSGIEPDPFLPDATV
jgi:hypothetical protein